MAPRTDARSLPLSEAKAHLSEVIRGVRRSGRRVLVTVDGEPAVEIVPVQRAGERLTPAQVATDAALAGAIRRLAAELEPFDAVDVVREGRR